MLSSPGFCSRSAEAAPVCSRKQMAWAGFSSQGVCGLGSVCLPVGLEGLKGLFRPKRFYLGVTFLVVEWVRWAPGERSLPEAVRGSSGASRRAAGAGGWLAEPRHSRAVWAAPACLPKGSRVSGPTVHTALTLQSLCSGAPANVPGLQLPRSWAACPWPPSFRLPWASWDAAALGAEPLQPPQCCLGRSGVPHAACCSPLSFPALDEPGLTSADGRRWLGLARPPAESSRLRKPQPSFPRP